MRLVGGIYEGEGRVEVCLGGAWGTIRDSYWGTPDATVACRQLGYSVKGIKLLKAFLSLNIVSGKDIHIASYEDDHSSIDSVNSCINDQYSFSYSQN